MKKFLLPGLLGFAMTFVSGTALMINLKMHQVRLVEISSPAGDLDGDSLPDPTDPVFFLDNILAVNVKTLGWDPWQEATCLAGEGFAGKQWLDCGAMARADKWRLMPAQADYITFLLPENVTTYRVNVYNATDKCGDLRERHFASRQCWGELFVGAVAPPDPLVRETLIEDNPFNWEIVVNSTNDGLSPVAP